MSIFGLKSNRSLPATPDMPQPLLAGYAPRPNPFPGAMFSGGGNERGSVYGRPMPSPMPIAPGQGQPASMPWSSHNLPGEGMPAPTQTLGSGEKLLGNIHPGIDFDRFGDVAGKMHDKGIIGAGKRHNGFFSKNGAWRDVLGALGDSLAAYGGSQIGPGYMATKIARQNALRDHNWRMEELQTRMNAPKMFNSGTNRVAYNPATGQSEVIYDGQSNAEDYAGSLGYEPGTPEYNQSVQDYILRSYGPTATGNRNANEDHRQGNRLGLEGVRQGNRVQLGKLRIGGQAAIHSLPTFRDTHPQPHAGRGHTATGGQTATDPKTGQKVQWDGAAWVPVS